MRISIKRGSFSLSIGDTNKGALRFASVLVGRVKQDDGRVTYSAAAIVGDGNSCETWIASFGRAFQRRWHVMHLKSGAAFD